MIYYHQLIKNFKFLIHGFLILFFNFQIYSTQNQIHKYDISFSQQFGTFIINMHWSSSWTYNTTTSNTFLLAISSSIKQQIVISHAHYIFITHLQWFTNNFRAMHTNNQVHYSKMKYHSFKNAIKHQNKSNQCANIDRHIHTQCTLILIFRLLLFILGTFPWWVETQPTFYHMVALYSFIITTGLCFPTSVDHDLKSQYMNLKSSDE